MPEHEHQRFMKRRHSIRYRGARMRLVSSQTGETPFGPKTELIFFSRDAESSYRMIAKYTTSEVR